ncbi:hypothetical protein CAEBREN_21639 [Caenorhabditis brenneri]|uniref:Skp1-related protein n=1 Tax=Caenorhabditis brenneri TaxID=135651 RepID=G0NAX1_CAEBE|nr:hypothetical protein CAEBREN_21639 [Caenorhabditis brenneri]
MVLFGNEGSSKVDKNLDECFILVSSDKKEFPISQQAIKHSKTLAQMISTLNISTNSDEKRIPVENVQGEHLDLIVQWCEHHKEEPVLEDEKSIDQDFKIPDWDRTFLEVDNETLFHFICAANYLDIELLMIIACKTVALMAKGRTPEEMRVIFGVNVDEEEQLMMQTNAAPQVEIVEAEGEE